MTISELIEHLTNALDDHGDLNVNIATQPRRTLAGGIDGIRVTHRTGDDEALFLFSDTTEYGPRFHEDEDDNTVEAIY